MTAPGAAGSTFLVHRFAQACLAALIGLAATRARANPNDLELWRLGNPDPITVCTKCDGSDTTAVPADPQAQSRFARLTAMLGLAFLPSFHEAAGSLGQSGFEVGVSGHTAFPRLSADEWPTSLTQGQGPVPFALALPQLHVRKGLGGSFELGAAATWLSRSQMVGLSGELRFSPLDGIVGAPDLSLRAHGTRVVGASSLDLTVLGADVGISKEGSIGGVARLQPYFEGGLALVNAQSGILNFRPDAINPRNPSAQAGAFHTAGFLHNVYYRGAVGLRLLAGPAVLGLEGGFAWGVNAVQNDPLPSGASPPTQVTRLWTASGHLGLGF